MQVGVRSNANTTAACRACCALSLSGRAKHNHDHSRACSSAAASCLTSQRLIRVDDAHPVQGLLVLCVLLSLQAAAVGWGSRGGRPGGDVGDTFPPTHLPLRHTQPYAHPNGHRPPPLITCGPQPALTPPPPSLTHPQRVVQVQVVVVHLALQPGGGDNVSSVQFSPDQEAEAM